jgi:hypothetical protein
LDARRVRSRAAPGGLLALGFFGGESTEPFDHAGRVLESHGFEVLENHRRAERGQRPLGSMLCRRIEP